MALFHSRQKRELGYTAVIYLAVFLSSYCYIGLKAVQQLQVCNYQFKYILPTSMGLAACEIFLVYNVAKTGWDALLWLSLGFGAGLGAMTAMYAHKRRCKK